MPLELQSYLLRVLEDGVVHRVGSHEGRQVDLRLVSMTHRDLAAEVAGNRLRKDLFYRIAPLRLRIPLRERADDIAILLEHFGLASSQRTGRPPPRYTAGAIDALRAYHWPGNIRELRNLVELVAVMSLAALSAPRSFPRRYGRPRRRRFPPWTARPT